MFPGVLNHHVGCLVYAILNGLRFVRANVAGKAESATVTSPRLFRPITFCFAGNPAPSSSVYSCGSYCLQTHLTRAERRCSSLELDAALREPNSGRLPLGIHPMSSCLFASFFSSPLYNPVDTPSTDSSIQTSTISQYQLHGYTNSTTYPTRHNQIPRHLLTPEATASFNIYFEQRYALRYSLGLLQVRIWSYAHRQLPVLPELPTPRRTRSLLHPRIFGNGGSVR